MRMAGRLFYEYAPAATARFFFGRNPLGNVKKKNNIFCGGKLLKIIGK